MRRSVGAVTARAETVRPATDRGHVRLRREAWGFAIGSACFFVGALPWYADWLGAVGANLTFFIGSIFFTPRDSSS